MTCSHGFLYIGPGYLLVDIFLLVLSFFPALSLCFIFLSPLIYTGYASILGNFKSVLMFLIKNISFSLTLCMEDLSSGEKLPKTLVQRGAEFLGGYEVTSQERAAPCEENKVTLSLQRHEDGSCTLRAVQCLDDPRIPEAVSSRTQSFVSERVPALSLTQAVAEDVTAPLIVAAETGSRTEINISSSNCEKHFTRL
jgi:hypothetical protein